MADGQPVDPAIVDLSVLLEWMDARGLGEGPLDAVEPLAGGTQNLLLKFDRAGRTYVLRRPPEHKRKNSDETMRREGRVLGALADTDVPHPRLMRGERRGGAWRCVLPDGADRWLPGDLGAARVSCVRRCGSSLDGSVVHRCTAVVACRRPATEDLDGLKPEGYLERQVPRWQAQLESYSELDGYPGPDLPHLVEIQAYLETNRPEPSPTGIIHGDYHLANVMFRPDAGEIAAIVDWELATQGDPLIDLGLVVAFCLRQMAPQG